MGISLTEAAVRHVQRQLQERGHGLGVRVAVRSSGCSGLAYVLEFVDQADSVDKIFESDGVRVFVDQKSLLYLDGTELDFVRVGLNEGFRFKNPNVKNECGCGESFQV